MKSATNAYLPKVPVPMFVRVLRRQKTCLEKRVRSLTVDQAKVRAGLRVIDWANRFLNHESNWNKQQLRMAVRRMESFGK